MGLLPPRSGAGERAGINMPGLRDGPCWPSLAAWYILRGGSAFPALHRVGLDSRFCRRVRCHGNTFRIFLAEARTSFRSPLLALEGADVWARKYFWFFWNVRKASQTVRCTSFERGQTPIFMRFA